MSDEIFAQAGQLSGIADQAAALVQYALALEPTCALQWDGSRFVMRPLNFVTFSVHFKRANNLTVTLRGNVSEFDVQTDLDLKKDQNGYSIFEFETRDQLAAASKYIEHAHKLASRGRTRDQRTLKTIEV